MSLDGLFRDPPVEFRQAPFWFWNYDLDPDRLIWQIEQMRLQGLGGFVMHARHGLRTPYLGGEWLECIRRCCEAAKDRGMIAWAYDECAWPSGPANGAVIEDHANRLQYLRMESETIEGPAEITFGDDVVVAHVQRENAPPKRVHTPTIALEKGVHRVWRAVRFECPPIFWFDSYLDTLSPEACQAFITSTYDLHEEKLGDLRELGLAGFFTDEPALSTYPDDLGRVPWTGTLPEVFRQEKGYDLLDRIPDLFQAGNASAQLRYDYWDVASTMFERAFVQAIGEWCDARGLQLIGHPLGEEPLLLQFRCLGDIFKYLKHQHMPGMDHLTLTVGKNNPLSMTPKLVTSAALLAGRDRTMTETFGESGWCLALRDMKWMCDWQMVHGINYFIPHAFYYTICGQRKKDSPPSEFFQAPHWPHYHLLADYTARVTAMMTGGDHVAKIALLYPMGSVWADFVPGEGIPESVQAMEAAFAPLGEMLLEMHRDFLILDEESLAEATVKDGAFTVKGLRFEALIIPKLTCLRHTTIPVVQEIAAQSQAIAVESDTVRVLGEDGADPVQLSAMPGMACVDRPDAAALAHALTGVTPDAVLEGAPDVYYLHRRKEGKDLFFFANTAREAVDATASIEAVGEAMLWDPETGDSAPASGQRVQDDRLELPLHFEGGGSQLVVVDTSRPLIDFTAPAFEASESLEVCPDLWHFTPFNGNFLALKRWSFTTETRHKVNELRYSTEFVLTEELSNLRLILDGIPAQPPNVPDTAMSIMAAELAGAITLDGRPLDDERHWEVDAEFRVVGLGNPEPGTHRLEILVRDHGWFSQTGLQEYVWLAGDFMVDESEGLPRLGTCRGVRPGAWETQGYPYFSGTAAYAADVTIPDGWAGKRAFLDAGGVGNILEVEIDGRTVGVRAWAPYRFDVTQHLCPGRSNLVVLKVTNTARNFLEGPDPDHPSGLLSNVHIEIG